MYLSRNETISGFLARQEDDGFSFQSGRPDSLFTTQLKAVTLMDRASRLKQRLRSRESEILVPIFESLVQVPGGRAFPIPTGFRTLNTLSYAVFPFF